jgi:hypothetical protein
MAVEKRKNPGNGVCLPNKGRRIPRDCAARGYAAERVCGESTGLLKIHQ